MADKKNSPPAGAICGTLDNPGNANKSSVVLDGQGPYLMVHYKDGTEPISISFSSGFDSGPQAKICPQSCVTFAVTAPAQATIEYSGIVDLKWCWTDDADGCCSAAK